MFYCVSWWFIVGCWLVVVLSGCYCVCVVFVVLCVVCVVFGVCVSGVRVC